MECTAEKPGLPLAGGLAVAITVQYRFTIMPVESSTSSEAGGETSSGPIALVGKIAGIVLFAGMLSVPTPEGMPPSAQRLAAVTLLMAMFWLTQAMPIAATSLIPLVAFPLLGIQTSATVSQAYINRSMFLFLGGFIIALGIEKWGLHRRMALHIVRVIGGSPRRLVLGFMLATAFLSMWISNTASTLLMMPIGLAMLASLSELTGPDDEPGMRQLGVVLMLAIAYSASIGGLTTLVGTPTNVQFQAVWAKSFPRAPELSTGEWMACFVPFGVLFLLCAWLVLTWRLPAIHGATRVGRRFFTERLRELGLPSRAEWLMFLVFGTTALLWVFHKPLRIGEEPLLPGWSRWTEALLRDLGATAEFADAAVHDSTIAMAMALLMFLIPAARDDAGRTRYLMDWKTAESLPWGILLLIGGGFALAGAFDQTGLSQWIGERFAETVEGWPLWLLVGAVCLLMTFLTEFTSNVATLSALLPILAGVSLSLGVDPRLMMMPAAISTSCAFMLPIATPPNAIIFGSGRVRMGQMARYGIALNLLGVVLLTVVTFVLLVPQLGISLEQMPEWAGQRP